LIPVAGKTGGKGSGLVGNIPGNTPRERAWKGISFVQEKMNKIRPAGILGKHIRDFSGEILAGL
jgi:hypothetical protein